jgi:hypothetical protein
MKSLEFIRMNIYLCCFEGTMVCLPGEEPMERSEEKWDNVAGFER